VALNSAALQRAILRVTDASRSDFGGFPTSAADAAARWAAIARTYFADMTAPSPHTNPGALDVAEAAFRETMRGAIVGGVLPWQTFRVWFPAAWAAFAAALGPLCVPVGTPPPVPPVIPVLPNATSAEPPAAALASVLDAWARTGPYLVGPTPTPWA
jgi:hypothetical protein